MDRDSENQTPCFPSLHSKTQAAYCFPNDYLSSHHKIRDPHTDSSENHQCAVVELFREGFMVWVSFNFFLYPFLSLNKSLWSFLDNQWLNSYKNICLDKASLMQLGLSFFPTVIITKEIYHYILQGSLKHNTLS